MNRAVVEVALSVLLIIFVATVLNWNLDAEGAASLPAIKSYTPHINLIAPDKGVGLYTSHQEFLYRVENLDYDADCQLLVNGVQYGTSNNVGPTILGQFDANLEPGTYRWKVQCQLLNGRTISSPDRILDIHPSEDIQEAFAITGNAVTLKYDPHLGQQGIIITMVALAGLVWLVVYRRR